MSAIADFLKLPVPALGGATSDDIRRLGTAVAAFPWSGYILPVALCYLQERRQIDLLHSEFDTLAQTLSEATGTTHIILTHAHKEKFLARLSASPPPQSELCDFYNEFNDTNETDAGEPMAAAIDSLRTALTHIDKNTAVVIVIG